MFCGFVFAYLLEPVDMTSSPPPEMTQQTNDLEIIVCPDEGFVDATHLCARMGVRLDEYCKSPAANDFAILLIKTGTPSNELIRYIRCRAWIHPDMGKYKPRVTTFPIRTELLISKFSAVHLGYWVSPLFGLLVGRLLRQPDPSYAKRAEELARFAEEVRQQRAEFENYQKDKNLAISTRELALDIKTCDIVARLRHICVIADAGR